MASVGLDADRSTLYVDLVLSSLTEATRKALQAMNPANYEYQSEFARRYFLQGKVEGEIEGVLRGKLEGKVEGRAEGKADGKAELLIRLATLKFGALPANVGARIQGAASAELDSLGEALLAAATLDEWLGASRGVASGA